MQPKDLLAQALPFIGAAATGNVPALVALAAEKVGQVLGTKVDAKPDAIAAAVAGATPEQMVALKSAELDFQLKMKEAGYKDAEDLRHVELETQKVYIGDTNDARNAFRQDRGVFWLGIAVLVTFFVDMVATMALIYGILTGGITVKDVGLVAAVFGLLGSLNGYVAANAQQVLSFYFGSSRGSQENHRALADAIKGLGSGNQTVQGPQ